MKLPIVCVTPVILIAKKTVGVMDCNDSSN